MSAVHRVVMATLRKSRATAQLRAEELRSQRDSMATISKGQQSAAIALGKRLREADRIAESWSRVLAALDSALDSALDDDRPCLGFPDNCPTLHEVPAEPPAHGGGVRCGCAGTRSGLNISSDPRE